MEIDKGDVWSTTLTRDESEKFHFRGSVVSPIEEKDLKEVRKFPAHRRLFAEESVPVPKSKPFVSLAKAVEVHGSPMASVGGHWDEDPEHRDSWKGAARSSWTAAPRGPPEVVEETAQRVRQDFFIPTGIITPSPQTKDTLGIPAAFPVVYPRREIELPEKLVPAVDEDGFMPLQGMGEEESEDLKEMCDLRRELVQSPQSKHQLKLFLKELREKEKDSIDTAVLFAEQALRDRKMILESSQERDFLPEKLMWRIHLQLADLMRRMGRFEESRTHFQHMTRLQPYAAQGWAEYARMEEDCGNVEECRKVFEWGLKFCPLNDVLMIRYLRFEEALGNINRARSLLAQLKGGRISRSWRIWLEGGLMEGRAGNLKAARFVFKSLMKHVKWYGPVYLDAIRLEERNEEYKRALRIAEKGVAELPRYGPSWMALLRLTEILHGKEEKGLEELRALAVRASDSITVELKWKIHVHMAQAEARYLRRIPSSDMHGMRSAYVRAIQQCPQGLQWKVWVDAGRAELRVGNEQEARWLVERAFQTVPKKAISAAVIEHARLEDHLGNVNVAREILEEAQQKYPAEWKLYLERVFFEQRTDCIDDAIVQAQRALQMHSGTGRLWAVLIHLNYSKGPLKQLSVFFQALQAVPKSGEVWCEGARILMRPTCSHFSLPYARAFLDNAIEFTPQYGDSFVEYVRLELLDSGKNEPSKELQMRCSKAEPNYGTLWFKYRVFAFDGTMQVLRTAHQAISKELDQHQRLYTLALLRSSQPTFAEEVHTGGEVVPSALLSMKTWNEDERWRVIFGDGV